jgi:lysophospholipase L1-like esterase
MYNVVKHKQVAAEDLLGSQEDHGQWALYPEAPLGWAENTRSGIARNNMCRSRLQCLVLAAAVCLIPTTARAQVNDKWVTAWAGSVQGPYPVGNATVQPDLSAVFPSADTGARDQSFRLIVRPDLWGPVARLRLSNAFGTRPITFDGVFAGIQMSGSSIVKGTNHAVTFGTKSSVTIAPGESAWSDPVALPFWRPAPDTTLSGRKLAVSFHISGDSGPMTWHAKALTTSYVTLPGTGSKGQDEGESAFRASTTSWYFLDAIDMRAPRETRVVVAFGDSITDGTASTLNGDDRWPDVLSRRLHAVYGDSVSVVNTGIGGNRVAGPAEYSPQKPFSGGPSAGQRLERDVLSLSGVSAVIWLEGINDFSAGATVDAVQVAMRDVVGRLRSQSLRVFGATLTSAVGNSTGGDGGVERDMKRRVLNMFIRASSLFDGVFDFDRATLDSGTGAMREEFVPNSTTGGAGDHLHPNRLGYAAIGQAIDLQLLMTEKP